MSEKKVETASFVLRLSQKIFQNENNEPDIQWRGNIRHVQTGEETRFSNFETARDFVQEILKKLTLNAVEGQSEDEIKGVLVKSFDFWKKVATATPKLVIESIKDPKKQATHFQEQIEEQIHQISDTIGQKIDSAIHSTPKTENREMLQLLLQLTEQVEQLNKKVDALTKKQP